MSTALLIALAVAALVVVIVGFVVWNITVQRAARNNLEQARGELAEQIRGVAQMVFDLNDPVTISGSDDLEHRYDEASVEFNELEDRLSGIDNGPDMAALNDRIDMLRWRLEWIEARIDGRPPPREPRSDSMVIGDERVDSSRQRVRSREGTCFFDPDHRPGTVPASVDAGSVVIDVLLCRDCDRKLEDGVVPEPRILQSGSRRVPAARAPLSYGGLELDIPDRFRISGRDLGRPISVDWSQWPSPAPSKARSEQLPNRSSRGRRPRSRRSRR